MSLCSVHGVDWDYPALSWRLTELSNILCSPSEYLLLCIWQHEQVDRHTFLCILNCLPPWNRFLASTEISHFWWNLLRCNTEFRRANSCPSGASWIQSPLSHLFSLKSISVLSLHLNIGFASGLFPSGFPTKTLCEFFLFLKHATFLARLILLD